MAPAANTPRNRIETSSDGRPCRWCGTVFLATKGPGRPRQYCSQSCRQQHYIERRTAVGAGRDPNRIVIDRATFERYESTRLQLRLALDDLERTSDGGTDLPSGIDWVVEHARALVALELSQAPEGGQQADS